ncbi:MAG: transglutaminase domain-containing protein [Intestinibacillus sp.]
MRKILGALVLAAVCVWAAASFAPGLLSAGAKASENNFQAAGMLLDTLEQGGDSMTFRARGLNESGIFRALEATYPYAFSLHCTRRGQSTITVQVEVENREAQKQAALLAEGVVRNLIADDMLLRDRLRVLHDYLIKSCVYDTATAEAGDPSVGSGADAPFTAAGALLNGRAVCAGYARAYMLLCRAAGIDMIYIADKDMNHGWNAVRLYGDVYYIDTTFDDPVPDRGELVSTEYFLKTADDFAQTHTWDREFYNEMIDYALPRELNNAQRLYDLGLLDAPPSAAAAREPMEDGRRRALVQMTGVSLTKNMTEAQAADAVWAALNEGTLARALVRKGAFDEVRARQVGIYEEVMQK